MFSNSPVSCGGIPVWTVPDADGSTGSVVWFPGLRHAWSSSSTCKDVYARFLNLDCGLYAEKVQNRLKHTVKILEHDIFNTTLLLDESLYKRR